MNHSGAIAATAAADTASARRPNCSAAPAFRRARPGRCRRLRSARRSAGRRARCAASCGAGRRRPRRRRRIEAAPPTAVGRARISSRTMADHTCGAGRKAPGPTSSSLVGCAPRRQHDAEAAVLATAGRGDDAVDDFLLQHEMHVGDGLAPLRADGTAAAWKCCRAGCRPRAAAAALSASARKSNSSASASCMRSAGCVLRNARAARPPGRDRFRSRRARRHAASSGAVRAPRPGPISTSASPGAARSPRRCARSPPDRAGSAGRSACGRACEGGQCARLLRASDAASSIAASRLPASARPVPARSSAVP